MGAEKSVKMPFEEIDYHDNAVVAFRTPKKADGSIDLRTVLFSPMRVDVSRAIKKGLNKLEIEVVKRWPNRLIGDGKLPEDQHKTKTNITHFFRKPKEGKHTLLPSGLIGPVQLIIENFQHESQ